MSQIVKLRRSSVSGQKPTNSNLQLGELALNTTDGKVYMAVSGSLGPSVEELITTNTVNTGSLQLVGSITASAFSGSAVGLTNVPFQISGSDLGGNTYNKQFTKLQFDDSTGLNVSESVPGTAFISIGSHFKDIFVSGSPLLSATGSDAFEVIGAGGLGISTSITDTNGNGYIKELTISATSLSSSLNSRINVITGSINGLNNFTSSVVLTSQTSSMTVLSASYAATASFVLNAGGGGSAIGSYTSLVVTSASSTWSFTHNTGQRYPIFQVFDNNGYVVIPSQIQTIDDNNANIIFPSPQTGRVIASLGGGNGTTQPFTSSSLWTVNHNLGTDYPDVTVWDSNRNIVFPNRIESVNTNQVKIYFSQAISGYVSLSRGGHMVTGSGQVSLSDITWVNLLNKPNDLVSGSSQLTGSYDTRYVLSGSITQTTWDNIANKPSGLISGSIQVELTGTTGYSTFSSSVATTTSGLTSTITSLSSSLTSSIGSLSSSVATTTSGLSSSIGSLSSSVASIDNTQNGRLDSLETASGSVRSDFNTFTSSYNTGSFTGSFKGDGTNLYNIPASGVTGLNLNKIISGSVSASISPDRGLEINTNVYIDGSLTAKELFINYISSSVLYQSGSTKFGDTSDDNHSFTGSVLVNGNVSATSITGSINFNNLTNVPTLVSGSSQIFTGYDYEIHVSQVDGNDTTGNGGLLTPVASITKALTLVTGQRRTVVIHPGSYTESPSITTQYTVLTTFEPLGGNTAIIGTVSTSVGCTIAGLAITNLTITAGTSVGVPNIINCNITGTLTKSGNATFTDIHNCDIGTACNITGTGLVTINDGNPNFVTVNNAGANVIIKNAMSCVAPSVTAGTLNITDSVVIAAVTNAVTSNASSVVTLANSQFLISALNNVAPVSLSGFYSIFNCVFDKPNSTLVSLSGTGGSTNSVDYFQYIDADNITTKGLTVTGSINVTNGITGSIDYSNITNKPTLVSGSSQISYTGITNIPSGIVSGSEQLTGSYDTRYVLSGSITQTTWDNIANKPNDIVSSSTQIGAFGFLETSSFNTYTSSNDGRVSSLESFTSSLNTNYVSETEFGTYTGSINTFTSSVNTYTSSNDGRVSSLESKTGSYATTGSNSFIGIENVTGSLIVSNSLNVIGTQNVTGSLIVSNSLKVIGNENINGNLSVTGSVVISGSLDLSNANVDNSRYLHIQSTSGTTWNIVHNLNYLYPSITVYDASDKVMLPAEITSIDANTTQLTFAVAESGHALASVGGISTSTADRYLHTQTSATGSWVIDHNIGYKYVTINVYDGNDEQLIPQKITAVSVNRTQIDFATPTAGNATITVGGPRTTSLFVQTGSFYNTTTNIGISGSLVVTGDVDGNSFNTTSDKKLKTNLVRIENALDKIEKLNGYTFDWLEEYSEDRTRQIGMVADEVYEVQPELISHRNIVLSNKEEKIKLLDYSKVTAILIEAIKELNDKVTKLENKKKKK